MKALPLCLLAALGLGACRTATPHFDAADKNRDGKMTLAEWQAHLTEVLFRENDADRNGQVTFAEWQANNPGADAARFRSILDTDGSGAVTLQEGYAAAKATHFYEDTFRAMDEDRDGFVTRKEALRQRDVMAARGF